MLTPDPPPAAGPTAIPPVITGAGVYTAPGNAAASAAFPGAARAALSPAQAQELATAARRFRKIRGMARNAFWGSFTSGFIGLVSVYFSIGSVSGVAISVAMVFSAIVQFRAARRLGRLEPKALEHLAWNQIILGGLFVLYGAWCLLTISSNSGQTQQLLAETGVGAAGGAQVGSLIHLILVITDTVLILFGLLFQGGAGLYYFWRRKYVAAFETETPGWILDLYRKQLLR